MTVTVANYLSGFKQDAVEFEGLDTIYVNEHSNANYTFNGALLQSAQSHGFKLRVSCYPEELFIYRIEPEEQTAFYIAYETSEDTGDHMKDPFFKPHEIPLLVPLKASTINCHEPK